MSFLLRAARLKVGKTWKTLIGYGGGGGGGGHFHTRHPHACQTPRFYLVCEVDPSSLSLLNASQMKYGAGGDVCRMWGVGLVDEQLSVDVLSGARTKLIIALYGTETTTLHQPLLGIPANKNHSLFVHTENKLFKINMLDRR